MDLKWCLELKFRKPSDNTMAKATLEFESEADAYDYVELMRENGHVVLFSRRSVA